MQKLFLALALVCVCLLSYTYAAEKCEYHFVNGETIDFSHVGTLKGKFNEDVAYLNLCKNIPVECPKNGESSACVPSKGTSDDQSFASKSPGAAAPMNVYDATTKINTIKESSGLPQCYAMGWQSRKLSINITCGSKDDATFTITEVQGQSCSFAVSLTLDCGGGAGGLSGGGLFLIIFFSLFAAYFIIGFLVCKFVFKKEGMDAVPQRSFWCALPGFFIAGCKCLIGKIRGTGSKSSGSSLSSEYGSTDEV
jgi:hypothetical protein